MFTFRKTHFYWGTVQSCRLLLVVVGQGPLPDPGLLLSFHGVHGLVSEVLMLYCPFQLVANQIVSSHVKLSPSLHGVHGLASEVFMLDCPFQLVSNQIVTWVGTSRSPKKCMGLRCIPHNMGMSRFGIGDKTVTCTVGGGLKAKSAQVPHMFPQRVPNSTSLLSHMLLTNVVLLSPIYLGQSEWTLYFKIEPSIFWGGSIVSVFLE
jgi:hypothetical protein